MTKGETMAGSPPVILMRLMIMSLASASSMHSNSLSESNVPTAGLPAFEQKRQWALHPRVTLTKRLTEGEMGCAGMPGRLQPCVLRTMGCPKSL
jgi:hypothetical protein